MGPRGLIAIAVLALGACGDNIHLGISGGGTLTVSPEGELRTSESGGTAQITLALTVPPLYDITVELSTTDPAEGTVSPATLTFVRGERDAQIATIVGIDDDRVDGDRPYVVHISGRGVGELELDVVNEDDDMPGITVAPQLGLLTNEAGATAQFEVSLQSQPLASVTIPVTSSDPGEGLPDPTSLTFTEDNWYMPQPVVVTGQQDAVADGTQEYTIVLGPATSDDGAYGGLDADDVSVQNIDDDVAGIAVVAPASLATSESGAQQDFAVVLQTEPADDVTITLSSTDTGEAIVSTTQLVFTPATWNVPQTVTVTGVDDDVDDGDQPFTITLAAATSNDPVYAGLDPDDVAGINSDDDTAGVAVTPTSGLTTSEAGGTSTFTVALTSQPLANVTIGMSSSDTGEGLVAPATLTFTPQDWNQPQLVTVTGVDDAIADGIQAYTIVLAPAVSGDPGYSGVDPANVSVVNLDNDTKGITVDPINGLVVSEYGDTDTFTIVLDAPPTANVRINLSSSDTSEGTVSPANVTFTPLTWNLPRTITVRGLNDSLADGPVNFSIITSAAISADPAYNGLAVPDVQVTNVDNDTPYVYVRASRRLTVSENGQSTTFQVRLTLAPTATVTCPVASSDTTEGVVSPQTLVFGPTQFGFQTVTVAGVDDTLRDGDRPFTVVLGACTSTDARYNGFNPRDVSALNRDND